MRFGCHEEVMKTKLAVIAIGALAFMTNEASARHQASAQRFVRHAALTLGQANGHVSRQAPRFPSSKDNYQSYSQGHQSYPNPDRGPYPTPIPDWAKGY
jgi:hypothetical protein